MKYLQDIAHELQGRGAEGDRTADRHMHCCGQGVQMRGSRRDFPRSCVDIRDGSDATYRSKITIDLRGQSTFRIKGRIYRLCRPLMLRIPKLRKGSYFLGVLEPRRLAENAPTAVVQEAYIPGDRLCNQRSGRRVQVAEREHLARAVR